MLDIQYVHCLITVYDKKDQTNSANVKWKLSFDADSFVPYGNSKN